MGDFFKGWTVLEWVLMILYVVFLILAFPFLTGQADERAQKMPMMEVIELHE